VRSPALKESWGAVPAAGDSSAGAQSAPSRPVVVPSAAPWGKPWGLAQWRWAYETPFGRTGLFLAPMIPCRHLYGYFCQAPLARQGQAKERNEPITQGLVA